MPNNQPSQKKILRERLSNLGLRILRSIVKYLPQWFVFSIMEGLYFLALIFMQRNKKICRTNLASVYTHQKDGKEIQGMVHQCIKNIGRTMMDLLYYVEHPEELKSIVQIKNEQRLNDAFALNKGIVAVTAHMGNFPLLFVSLVQRGYKVNVIIRPMRDNVFSDFMYDLCAKWKINMIQTLPRKNFIKESLAALKRNELLFILCDEVVSDETGVEVPFFNKKVMRTVGPAVFHQRMDSPIVPIFISKDENKRFNIYIEKPIRIEDQFSPEENQRMNIGIITTVIETFVRKYPLQWGGWLNKRWT